MFHSEVEIHEGAVIISDAHYSSMRPELLKLLQDIYSQKIQTSQLILMGDIFDALFGAVKKTELKNAEAIQLLSEISQKIEVIYLEGNHDFQLKSIFPNIKIFPLQKQPLQCTYKDKKVYLAHGDFDVSVLYTLYSIIIRNPYVLSFLACLDKLLAHLILKGLDSYLAQKEDCNDFVGFKEFIKKRFAHKYKCDYFIEGHFHQNKCFQTENFYYINLAAFACNQRYFIVKSLKDKELLEEKRDS